MISWYLRLVSPTALLFFVIWSEWFICLDDAGRESFRHIGQWGAMVVVILVGLAAFVGRFYVTKSSVNAVGSPHVV